MVFEISLSGFRGTLLPLVSLLLLPPPSPFLCVDEGGWDISSSGQRLQPCSCVCISGVELLFLSLITYDTSDFSFQTNFHST